MSAITSWISLPILLLIIGGIMSIVMLKFALKFLWIAIPVIIVGVILLLR